MGSAGLVGQLEEGGKGNWGWLEFPSSVASPVISIGSGKDRHLADEFQKESHIIEIDQVRRSRNSSVQTRLRSDISEALLQKVGVIEF